LIVEGKSLGAITLSYRDTHEFNVGVRDFVLSVAHEAPRRSGGAAL